MVVSIRMTEDEKRLADAYAKLKGASLSEVMKRALFEKIEDEFDAAIADKALKEYEEDKTEYSMDQVKEMFDL